MATEHEQNLVKDEYMKLQQILEDFDGKALTIKAWSVTLSAAGIVTAYAQTKKEILLIAGVSAIIFWLTEALWKTIQQGFYERIYAIEKWFQNDSASFPPFQIALSWRTSWQKKGQSLYVLYVMTWPHVAIPHVVVALSAFGCYLWIPPLAPSP
ncbi:MAG: hypothetical protein AAF950_08210 [Pseudomonadota bacterium]